ncbi:VOC family protein [Vulgatibacter incomptus]|uniref:PhnB protein n=1 Tax=Vulgatibacter incomptus TaxID=1391653 RepID=A0A0K1PGW9_9BACT|nr:VOC family protein [Vulgatibacter incomptus]AKU92671.1 PhnB protein [Vulgatibacter incomptus]
MAIKTAIPYLNANGKADEAIPFYEKALGAKVTTLMRFGDAMPDCPAALKNQVMHAALQVGDATIFLSDGAPDGAKAQPGGTVDVALDFDDAAQARGSFDGLSKGGTIVQPLGDAPWGGLFGALQDRFGIDWMFTSRS